MVRLEAVIVAVFFYFILFQFLMVRLEVVKEHEQDQLEEFFVSIPYGSIRRHRGVKCPLNSSVSIPYGSIRREHEQDQLEEFFVSIPYGSIRRYLLNSRKIRNLCFNSLWFD